MTLRLAGPQVMVEVIVVAAVVWLGHEHFDVLPDHLGRRVAENPLGRRVERLDDARSLIVMIPSMTFSTTARTRASASANSSICSGDGCNRGVPSPLAHRASSQWLS